MNTVVIYRSSTGFTKQYAKSIAKKEQKSEQDSYMARVLGTNFDISDKKYVQKLIEFIKEQESTKIL